MRLTSDRANGDVYQSVHTLNADNFSRSRSYSSRPCCAFRLSLSAARSILFARRRLAFHRGGPNGLRRACGAISTIANIESEQVLETRCGVRYRWSALVAACDVLGWCPSEGWRKRNGARPQHRSVRARVWDALGARQGRPDRYDYMYCSIWAAPH